MLAEEMHKDAMLYIRGHKSQELTKLLDLIAIAASNGKFSYRLEPHQKLAPEDKIYLEEENFKVFENKTKEGTPFVEIQW